MSNTIHLQFSRRQVYSVVAIILLVNLAMLVATYFLYFFYYQVPQRTNLILNLSYFNLAHENTLATTYSAWLLLAVAVVAAFCFIADREYYKKQSGHFLSLGWLFFSGVFSLLSFDEVGSFHERLGNNATFNLFGERIDWFLYQAAIGSVAVFMLLFSWKRLRANIGASVLIVVGLLLFVSLRAQENYELAHYSFRRPIYFILLEEGSEIFGSFCFLLAMTLSWIKLRNRDEESRENILIDLKFNLNPNFALAGTALFLSLLAGVQLFVDFYFNRFAQADEGIPENWFPGATAFLAAIILFIIYFNKSNPTTPKPAIYLLTGLFCLLVSFIYGSSFYHIYFFDAPEQIFLIVKIIFGSIVVALGFGLMRQINIRWSRIGIAVWAILFCISLILDNYYFARLGFISGASLLLALIPHIYRWQYQTSNSEPLVLTHAS